MPPTWFYVVMIGGLVTLAASAFVGVGILIGYGIWG